MLSNLVSNTVLQSLVILKCYHFVLISMEYINAFSLVVELELYFYLNTVNLSDKIILKITIYFDLYKHGLKI